MTDVFELDAEVVELAAYVPPAVAGAPLREVAFRSDAWLPDQVDRLRAMFLADEPLDAVVAAVGRPLQGVRSKIFELGLRRNSQRPWNGLEDEELGRRYGEAPASSIAQDLGRGVGAVYARAQVLGLTEPQAPDYTPWEDLQVREGYARGVPVAQIAVLIGRTLFGLRSHASDLGLRHATTPPSWSESEITRMLELAHHGVRYSKILATLQQEGFPPRTLSGLKGRLWATGYGRGWGRCWTPDEDELLRRAYAEGASLTPLKDRLGRSPGSLMHRARHLGIRGTHTKPDGFREGPVWSDEEIAKLRAEYGKRRPADIARDLGRPLRGVYATANRLGLKDRPRHSTDEVRAMEIAAANNVRLKDLAAAIGRPYGSLSKLAAKRGLDFSDPRHQRPKRLELTLAEILAMGEAA